MTWRIAYTDDEPDLREIAQISLELDPEFEVRCCASGAELLALLPQWQPDLVLLDVMMPGMDGRATLEKLRSLPGGAIPVIFITARAREQDVAELLSLGAAAVITKPFEPMELAFEVRQYLHDE